MPEGTASHGELVQQVSRPGHDAIFELPAPDEIPYRVIWFKGSIREATSNGKRGHASVVSRELPDVFGCVDEG